MLLLLAVYKKRKARVEMQQMQESVFDLQLASIDSAQSLSSFGSVASIASVSSVADSQTAGYFY